MFGILFECTEKKKNDQMKFWHFATQLKRNLRTILKHTMPDSPDLQV